MSNIPSKILKELPTLSPEERFEYSLTQFIENNKLWGLFGESGWLLLKADDDACLPVWPHEEFAVEWKQADFPDCEPKEIPLTDFVQQWLPGMQNNNTLVLVFPLSHDEDGVMLEAAEVLQCIEEDLEQ